MIHRKKKQKNKDLNHMASVYKQTNAKGKKGLVKAKQTKKQNHHTQLIDKDENSYVVRPPCFTDL